MFVSMYLCLYPCIYVCIHVSMFVSIKEPLRTVPIATPMYSRKLKMRVAYGKEASEDNTSNC